MTIPLRTFVMRPHVAQSTVGWNSSGKHVQARHDVVRRRSIHFGGDHNSTAMGQAWSYDPAADVVAGAADRGWTQTSPWCHGPGKISPGRPDDGQPCGMDYKLDRYWAISGGWRAGIHTGTCDISQPAPDPSFPGSDFRQGLLWLNPTTGDWTQAFPGAVFPTSGLISNGKTGYFDPVQRCLVTMDNVPRIERTFVDTGTQLVTSFTAGQTFAGGTGDLLPNGAQSAQVGWAFDVIGRCGYWILPYATWSGGNYHHTTLKFFRIDVDNPSLVKELARPPFGFGIGSGPGAGDVWGGKDTLRPVWDSRNRKVIWFAQRSICGMVHGIGVYTPTTNTWETLPILQDKPVGLNQICGNCVVYDSTNNVVILTGGSFCGVPGDDPAGQENSAQGTHYMLWRYQ